MAEKINSLEALFMHDLKDAYDAEHQLMEALPKMAEAAESRELKAGFKEHLEQTRKQVSRLEQIFKDHGEKPQRQTCAGMKGIVQEGKKIIEEEKMGADQRDAALIAAAQKAEHYEIATYGTMRTYAEQLGMREHARLLQTTLEEESATNEKLTMLAESRINEEAKR